MEEDNTYTYAKEKQDEIFFHLSLLYPGKIGDRMVVYE